MTCPKRFSRAPFLFRWHQQLRVELAILGSTGMPRLIREVLVDLFPSKELDSRDLSNG